LLNSISAFDYANAVARVKETSIITGIGSGLF